MKFFALMVFMLVSAVVLTSAYAQIYKSVDANGRISYSDAPPAQGSATASQVKTAPPPVTATPSNDWAEKEKAFRQRMQAKQMEDNARWADQHNYSPGECASARATMRELDRINGKHAYRRDSNGERVYIGDDERAKIQQNAQRSIEKNCR